MEDSMDSMARTLGVFQISHNSRDNDRKILFFEIEIKTSNKKHGASGYFTVCYGSHAPFEEKNDLPIITW
jgi:hypothetical protein